MELRTGRLVLTPPVIGDFDGFAALVGDAETMRFVGGAKTREAAWLGLQARVGGWAMLGFGMWMVREAGQERLIGEVGFLDAKREGVGGMGQDPEIGWALVADMQGRGLAREAVAAAVDWGAQRFARTVAMIDPEHVRSVRLAEGLGFRWFMATRYVGLPRGLWALRWDG